MKKEDLLQYILDDSEQMCMVCDLETFSIIYANTKVKMLADRVNQDYEGMKCYQYMLGRNEQCEFCPLRQMTDITESECEAEKDDAIFTIKTKIIDDGNRKLFVQYAWDITEIRRAERRYHSKISALMYTSKNAEVVFHFDITSDKVLDISGISENVSILKETDSVDKGVELISLFIVNDSDKKAYKEMFCRKSLLEAYDKGIAELHYEMDMYFYDGSIRPARLSGRLFVNPTNNRLEGIVYGVDCTDEKEVHKKLEKAYEEQAIQLEEIKLLNERLQKAYDSFKEADYDRRRDFLTGLRNRQDMFELFQDVLSRKHDKIKSMYMMDIDNFKMLNDHYGHTYGDECLRKIGLALNSYGDRHNIHFYRYGGEEILGICFGDDIEPSTIAEELVRLVESLDIKRDDMPLGVVTISLGYTSDNHRYEKMIDKADTAMYRAKSNGKNQAVCYEDIACEIEQQ